MCRKKKAQGVVGSVTDGVHARARSAQAIAEASACIEEIEAKGVVAGV
jgi:hypothetical protein